MRKIHLLSLLAAAVLSLSAWAQTAYITTPTAIYSTSATAESPLSFTDNGRSLQLNGKTLATKEIDSITFYLPDVTCVGGDISLLTEYVVPSIPPTMGRPSVMCLPSSNRKDGTRCAYASLSTLPMLLKM